MKISVLYSCAALVCFVSEAAVAKKPAQVEAVAKAVTVEIKLTQADGEDVGSGVIVHRQGDLYKLVTNRHVVCGRRNCNALTTGATYRLRLANGQQLRVSALAVKLLGKDLDLAVIQFRSSQRIPVAQVAESGSLKVGDRVYTAGYPYRPSGFSFNAGQVLAVVNKRLVGDKGGYTIVYNAETQPGMSGGGVFDADGKLVAIHGQGDRFRGNTQVEDVYAKAEVGSKTGYNRGIPVRWVVQGLVRAGVRLGGRDSVTRQKDFEAVTSDEFFIAGLNLWVEPRNNLLAGKQEAIQLFSKAIQRNPNYAIAYFMRAYAYDQIQNPAMALADYNKVIAIDPRNARSYNNRGNLKYLKFRDTQGALKDYQAAITINPQDADAYNNRGVLKSEGFRDFAGALADYNRAISLNPKYALAYNNRGILNANYFDKNQDALLDFDKAIEYNDSNANTYNNRGLLKAVKFNDLLGALADYDKAIALKPNFAPAYNNRGMLKANKLNDLPGSLADYNKAIFLNPNYAEALNNRGMLKANKLNDPQGALADYDKVISINPNFALAHVARGLLKYVKFRDRSGGIADVRQAVKLARAQGEAQILQMCGQILREWGVSE